MFPSWLDSALPAFKENPDQILPIGNNPDRLGGREHAGELYRHTWKWVAPPGVGDAPQHVFASFQLTPVSLDGPGDRPASYLVIGIPPLWLNFAMRQQGIPVQGGDVLLTGLYTPSPKQSPANQVYAGAGI